MLLLLFLLLLLLGCLFDTKLFYYNLWDEYLPHNAHIRCSGYYFYYYYYFIIIIIIINKNNNNNNSKTNITKITATETTKI